MTYRERINLCKKLLADIGSMIQDEDERSDLSSALDTIETYTASKAFTENTDEEKTLDSWNILMNTVERCHEHMDTISEMMFPRPPKYVTKEEAYGKLVEEYAEALSKGDETIASMNINEWMDANRYVIVKEGDRRLESSSGGNDDETVNSRTQF